MHLIDSWNNNVISNEKSIELINLWQQRYVNLGIKPHEKVILALPTSSEWIIQYLALESIGAVIIPIDLDDKALLREKIKIASASHIITSEEFKNDIISNNYNLTDTCQDTSLIIYRSKEIQPTVENCQLMIFTSGTDSTPKLAMLPAHSIDMVLNYYASQFNQYKFDNIIIALPLSAIYTIAICLAAIKSGKKLIFANYKTQNIFEVINEYRINLFPAVPLVIEKIYSRISSTIDGMNFLTKAILKTAIVICIQIRRFTNINLGRIIFTSMHKKTGNDLKVLLSGGAKIPSNALYTMYGLGYTIFEGYGLTETAGVITVRKGEYETIGTVGNPINDVKITIGSDRDKNEVVIHTNQLYSGYYNINDQHQYAHSPLKTGDTGFIDKNGNLTITGRIKNIIILADERKINSEWLEEFLQAKTGIQNPIVIAHNNNNKFGDDIILYIEKDAIKDINTATTLEYVNAQIKNICMINRIIYVDKFPRNKLGKCCRRELKDLFTQEAK